MKKVVKKLVSALSPAASIALELKKRPSELYPPNVRNTLKKNGDELVKKITIVRTPVESFVQNLMQVISFGKFKQAVKKTGYDDMFHLSLIINDKYTLDKQEVVKLVKSNRIPKNAQIVSMDVDKYLTLSQLVDDTKKKMGDDKFSNYSAKSNNCQDFLLNVLTANKLNAGSLDEFIKQDSTKVFKELPKITDKLANVLTDVGAVANKIVEGEGPVLFPKDAPFFGKGKNLSKKDLLYSKTKMPYDIVKEGRCWMVINKRSKKVHAKCTTKKNATAQLRILEEAKVKKGGKCMGLCEGEGTKGGAVYGAYLVPPEDDPNLNRKVEYTTGKTSPKVPKVPTLKDKKKQAKERAKPKPITPTTEETKSVPQDLEEFKKRSEEGTGVKKTSPWITYVKKHMTGMKGKSQQEIRDHMRKLAKDYKASK